MGLTRLIRLVRFLYLIEVKGPNHKTDLNVVTSAISSEREGLRTSDLVYRWSTMSRITDMHRDLKG